MKINTLLIATWLAGAALAVPANKEREKESELSKRFAIGGAVSAIGAIAGLFGSKSMDRLSQLVSKWSRQS